MKKIKFTEKTAELAHKAYGLNIQARKENIYALCANNIKQNFSRANIFDYGLQLCTAGMETETLEKILSNLVNMEHDEEEKRFKTIQKEALLHIKSGRHPHFFLWYLISFLKKEELEEVKNILSRESFAGNTVLSAEIYEELDSLLEKTINKETITDTSGNLSGITSRPFDTFHNADITQLSQLLKEETPDVTAFILALIEPEKAAGVLQNLSLNAQNEVSYRIASMDFPDMDMLVKIQNLEKKLLSLCGKNIAHRAAALDPQEFGKIIQTYITRQNAVTEAQKLYNEVSNTNTGSRQITERIIHLIQRRPLDDINKITKDFIKALLEEYPKTIAVIICILDLPKAASVLSSIPAHLQIKTALQIAMTDSDQYIKPFLNNETFAEITPDDISLLEKKLSALFGKNFVFESGRKKLTELLIYADNAAHKRIMDFLSDNYQELYKLISDEMFVFDDIVMLDDRAVQKVLLNIETKELALALKNADNKTQEKIFNAMPKMAAIMLKEDIECVKPADSADCGQARQIQRARKSIVSVIRHLEEMGEITAANYEDEMVL